mgnify:FL=1
MAPALRLYLGSLDRPWSTLQERSRAYFEHLFSKTSFLSSQVADPGHPMAELHNYLAP